MAHITFDRALAGNRSGMNVDPSHRTTTWLWLICATASLMCALALWKSMATGSEVDEASPISWCVGAVVFGVLAVIARPTQRSR